MAPIRSALALFAAILAVGCNGFITDAGAGPGPRSDQPHDGPSAVDPDFDPAVCADASPAAAPRRLRRLTQDEYARLLRDLLGEEITTAYDYAARTGSDEVVAGYAANGIAPVTESQVESYVNLAEELAGRALSSRIGGQLECAFDDEACVTDFVARFGRRAFRRPLSAEESADLMEVYVTAQAQWGAEAAMTHVLTILLASPQLLYHSEVGALSPTDPDLLLLTDFELAAELSFFLWGTIPDDALLDAAEGGLAGEDLEAEVRRMLDDPRALDTIETFTIGWLELSTAEDLSKDMEAYPEWNEEVAEAARQETLRFVRHVMGPDGDGTFATLMTAPYTFGDATVASLYGVDAPDPDDAAGRIALDPALRAGVLTQPAFLASHAYARDNSWVHRGKFVRERIFCQHLPSPPPDVEIMEANDPSRLTTPSCSSCHQLMDPIGIGFDRYDAIGRFHPNVEIDGLRVVGAEALEVPENFSGPVELAHALAESDVAHACFATQWFRYALRREETPADACAIHDVVERWRGADWDIRELLVALATSESFRIRGVREAE